MDVELFIGRSGEEERSWEMREDEKGFEEVGV
jgi:hypothetical protein